MLLLPLKLVRLALTHHPFLLSQNTHHGRRRHHHHHNRHDLEDEEEEDDDNDDHENDVCNLKPNFYNFHCRSSKPPKPKSKAKTKTPLLLFLPTRELIGDTYSLANIAREMGMDLHPAPSLSHIIFSFSSSSPSPPSSSSSSSASSSALSLSSSFSMPLPTGAVLISFPSLSSSSLSHLRSFVSLSKGLFKLVFLTADDSGCDAKLDDARNWDCCSVSLFSKRTGDRIDSMQSFSRALAGMGWTLFSTRKNPSLDSLNTASKSVYLFRKVDSGRVRGGRGNGERRVRELRLPSLDFRNAPLKILQYVVLMTGDVFYLG
ncbi:uncharacterized protein LOC120202474 [Hibiscus syriacus]|uniref:uncharacterized protein LOC120202474 n=1 Tax=Hibiscus syriacus TaxID=106335 RepID=UPI001922131E|nr:uncharacterized protein LOC120202474 [Hibiscus syriacus]